MTCIQSSAPTAVNLPSFTDHQHHYDIATVTALGRPNSRLVEFFRNLLTASFTDNVGLFFVVPFGREQSSQKAYGGKPQSYDDGVVPSAEMYALRGGKALASTLEDLSGFIPVPFLGDFMKVSIAVLEACEASTCLEATTIEENVKELQDRVYSLTLIIVDKVPVGSSADENLQGSINKLQSILKNIIEELNEIKQQRKWLLIFFRDMNKERVAKCLNHVNTAMEQFAMSHQLHVEELLDKIKSKYSDVSAQLSGARAQLSDIDIKVDRIEQAVKSTNKPHNAPQTLLPRQDMPAAHRIFFGRESVVNDVASLLSREDTSRVCITGVGGMGKTSVALAVVHSLAVKDIFPNYRFWVPCVEAKSADLLRRILYTQLRITADSYDSLDPLIKELNSSKERRLLLLDNFETPWLSGKNQDKVTDILVRLTELPHIALIVTMASQFPPSEDSVEWQHCPLPALDAAAARDTFQRLYPGTANAPKLNELLTAVGHIPLAITLMAADGKHSQATPKDLLKQWRKAGTGMNSTMDRRIGLSVQRVESYPEALELLSILSMLPAGTTGNNLSWWQPTLTSHSAAVAVLRTAALIEQDDGDDFGSSHIFLRPTIQAYMAQKKRISPEVQQQVHEACYKFILERKSVPDDAKFKQDLQELAGEETNIQGLLMQINASDMRLHALDALIAFALYQSWTKPSTVVATHALGLASAAKDSRRVAEAHECLGKIFLKLDRYEDACQHFEDARRYFKEYHCGADRIRAGDCSMQLADGWRRIWKSTDEVRALVYEAQADLSHDASDEYHIALGLLGVGYFLWWEESTSASLETLSGAKRLLETLDRSTPASIAWCLYLMGRCHAQGRNYSTALSTAKQGLVKAEEAGDDDLIWNTLNRTAMYLMMLSSHDESLDFVQRSLSLSRALGAPLSTAQDLELLGYNCAAKMDLQGARAAYEAARVHFASIADTEIGESGQARCSDNLVKMEGMEDGDKTGLLGLVRLKKPLPLD